MPKQCIEPNCTNNQWGGGYCLYHQYKRKLGTKTKRETKYIKAVEKSLKKAKIKPISDKQSKKLQKYEKGKKEKEQQLKESNQWKCIFCDVSFCDDDRPDWHHLLGRDGDLVSDMRYIFPAHTHCHIVIYHWGSYALLSSQRWYEGFLSRLKEIDIKLYNKEIRKKEKS